MNGHFVKNQLRDATVPEIEEMIGSDEVIKFKSIRHNQNTIKYTIYIQ